MSNFIEDSNLFETKTGALNIAPVKISGQYKIVVTENNDLYLDDYNNKRVLINKSQRFLPQLSNFLKIKSTISNYEKLRYGGFSNNNKLLYHAPLYIGKNNKLPDYFLINNIGYGNNLDTNNLTDDIKLGNISNLKRIISLKKCGIINIFNEILESNNYEYPFYSNFENHKIIIYGFDYIKNTKIRKEFSLLNNASNQTYFGSVNNNILNLFNDNNIIFPRFINIEFEFSDNYNTKNLFGNYYGFYSYENIININEFDELKLNNKNGIFTTDIIINNNLAHKQVWNNNLSTYKNLLFTTNSFDTKNTISYARLKINFVINGDKIKIYDSNDNIYFEYIISEKDIKNTYRETLIELSKNITKYSENQIICKLDSKLQNILNFELNSNIEDLHFKLPEQLNQYQFVDLFNTNLKNENILSKLFFKEINDNDVILNKIFDTQKVNNIKGKYLKFGNNEKYFLIKEFFVYYNNLVCRLENDFQIYNLRNDNLLIQIFEELNTNIYYHNNIPFLNYINDEIIISSNEQFNKEKYLIELKNKFNSTEFINAVTSFEKYKLTDYKQFVNDNEPSDLLFNDYPNVNNNQVLNMKFGSYGCTSYLTPNLYNFDINFYDSNGNVIYELEDLDKIKFHWFLIKSETPNYLNDKNYNFSKYRYFKDKPKITSRLIDTGTHCETIFLGVKYTLPRKYNNYLFAVYLDYNNIPLENILDDDSTKLDNYSFDIDNINKTIFLKINKYLDFIDLLRDGKLTNEPFIDLSFLYSVREAYNTKSNLVLTFKSGGLLLCDDKIPTIFNGQTILDWKTKINTDNGEKWLICLKRSTLVNTSPLTDLIPQNGEVIFYIYSKYNKIIYQSLSVKLIGIQYVGEDYVWCEDLLINFYDTKKLLINEFENLKENILHKLTTDDDLINIDNSYIKIDNSNILNNGLDNTFLTILIGNDNKIFKIINTEKIFSLKENYIEKNKRVEYLLDGEKTINEEIFKFPEFIGDLNEWNNIKFDFDNTTANQKITLFDRNQLWFLIKNLISTELKFKHNTESQTIKILNELLLSNLYEYSNLNSLPINGTNEFIKLQVVSPDFNVVVWNFKDIDNLYKNKVCKISRYSGPNIPILDEITNLSEFQIINHNKNQLLNIFDKNYGNVKNKSNSTSFLNINNSLGYNKYHLNILNQKNNTNNLITENLNFDINAIGIWDEIKGNIISSLFIKNDNIIIKIINSEKNIYSFNELFNSKITENNKNNIIVNQNILEQLLFNNLFPDKNKNYISKFNYNLDEYIYNLGIIWLINNFYTVDSLLDNDNKKINFELDNTNNQIIIDKNNYQPNGNYTLIWKRK